MTTPVTDHQYTGTDAVVILAWLPFGIALRGFVIAALWGWFAVPLGAPAITIPWAYGLGLLSQILTGDRQTKDRSGAMFIAAQIVESVLTLGIALVVHTLWMPS